LTGAELVALARALAEIPGKATPVATPEAVLAAARAGDTVAGEAVALFRAFMGAFAGDLALVFGAWGGVYLSGGLARAMAAELATPAFREAFEAKGRFEEAVAAVPTWIVTHPDPAFLGLARLARRLGG
jgi:glucokinase